MIFNKNKSFYLLAIAKTRPGPEKAIFQKKWLKPSLDFWLRPRKLIKPGPSQIFFLRRYKSKKVYLGLFIANTVVAINNPQLQMK